MRNPTLLACLLVVLIPTVAATAPPTALSGAYDDATEELTLTWSAPAQGTVDHYKIYLDGVHVDDARTTTFVDDLSSWSGTQRNYEVSAVDSNNVESIKSNVVTVLRANPPIPPTCKYAGVTIITSPPGVYPTIYWDCLPP